jgi:hypothetical protein
MFLKSSGNVRTEVVIGKLSQVDRPDFAAGTETKSGQACEPDMW